RTCSAGSRPRVCVCSPATAVSCSSPSFRVRVSDARVLHACEHGLVDSALPPGTVLVMEAWWGMGGVAGAVIGIVGAFRWDVVGFVLDRFGEGRETESRGAR